jgi:hypothetical protein
LRRLAGAQLAVSEYEIARPSAAVLWFNFADQPYQSKNLSRHSSDTLPPCHLATLPPTVRNF